MQGELILFPGRVVSPPLPAGLPASSLGPLIKHSGSLSAAQAHSDSSPWISKHLAQLAQSSACTYFLSFRPTLRNICYSGYSEFHISTQMPNHMTTTAQEQLLLPETQFVIHLMFTALLQPDRPRARFQGHLEKRRASPLSSI